MALVSTATSSTVPFKLPPRPLTYAGMQAYRLALHAQDRWQKA